MASTIPASGLSELPPSWRLLASPAVCDRGADYFLRGKVRPLPSKASGTAHEFEVQGTQRYQVHIDASDPLQSHCTCPHAQDVPVCKHMVAAWLTLQAEASHAAGTAPAIPAELLKAAAAAAQTAPARQRGKTAARTTAPASRKATTRLQDMQADLDFLQARPAAELCAWIAQQCDRDPQLAQQLSLWRQQLQPQPRSTAQWRSFLTQAMPQRRNLYGRELQRWAHDALAALQPLEPLLQSQPADIRTASTLALLRLYKLWETADDSHGQLYELHAWLQDLLLRSVHAEAPPASWLKDWLALLETDPLGNWDEAAVLDGAGPALEQAYSHHVITAWEAWNQARPATPSTRQKPHLAAEWEGSFQRSKLRKRYLWAMGRSLDTNALIALMQQTAASSSDWLDTVEFCERKHKPREALASAQQGLQRDPSHTELQAALLACYRRDGWDEEAYALAQRMLARRPHIMEHLAAVLQCAAVLGHGRDAALSALVEQALQQAPKHATGTQPPQLDISHPMAWLLHEGQWQRALELLDLPQHFCERRTRRKLALALPASEHARAVQLLQSILSLDMQSANSPYHEELQLVRHILARMPAADVAVWLAALRQRYARKPNFIKGLDALPLH
jgi:hypothetical protein